MPAKPLPKQATAGRFKPGKSGNPAGRKPGTRAKATLFGEAILQRDAAAIVGAVVTAAKAGDPTAMRLCLERLVPVRKGRPISFHLPALKTADDVGDAISAIAQAMSQAVLSPDEAAAVVGVVEARRRSIETSEHERRLKALEEVTNVRP